MKKFFSLLCATLLVFSASAAPVAKKAEIAKKAVAVEQVQKVQFEKVQTATLQSDGIQLEPKQTSNENQLNAAPAVKVINQKAAMQPKQMVAKHLDKAQRAQLHQQAANVARAPKRVAQSEELTITESEVDDSYVESDGEWDIYLLTTINGTDVIVNLYGYNETLEGTYDLATNMNEYSCVVDAAFTWSFYEEFTACSYTVTSLGNDQYSCEGSFSIESGDFTFSTTLSYAPYVPQVYEITASDFSMVDYGTDMYMTALDAAGNKFFFDVYYTGSFELGKTYTLADMDPDYSWYKLASGGGNAYTEASITVTEDQDELLHVVADVVLDNGDSYDITYDEKAFVPTGVKIDVNGTDLNGRYMSAYGFYLYTATWGDYTVQLAFDAEEEKAAYTNDDFIADYGLIYSDDEDIQLFKLASDNITITNTETTKTLAGSVYAKNGDEYVLNLVYEKPAVETATAIVEDAKLTKTSQFFHVDGNDTKGAYGITLYVVTKNLEGEFTVEDLDVYSSGVTDLSVKKWFDIDSCNIVSEKLGSNTLVISGLLHTSNEQLGRLIDLTFIMTARVDANGELMDIYGGIVTPAKGDTISLTRSEKGTAFFKNPSTGGIALGNQSGKTTMVAVNDSAYYWYNPISQFTTGYWIKGIKDKEANTINFDTAQVINVYNGGLLGLMKWMKATTQGKITIATDGAKQFALDINEDTLTLHGSAPFDMTQDIYFPGIVVPGYGFQGYGDAGTILTVNKPITERDTVDIVSTALKYNDLIASNKVTIYYATDVEGYYLFRVTSNNATSVDGTFKWSDGTINDPNSYFSVSGTDKNYFTDGEFTVVTNNKDIALTGWMIGEDEKYYRLDMSYTAPTVRDTLKFSGQGVTISECVSSQTGVQTGWFYELADASTGYEFLLQSTVVAEQYGTFSYADKTLGSNYYNVFDPQGNRQQFVEGSITVSNDGSEIVLDGELIAEDEKVYVLHFTQSTSVLNYDTDAPFDATFAYSDMSADLDEGVIGIYATNAEGLTIGLELYADPAATEIPAGVYTISDSQEAGTALQSLGVYGGYLTECFAGVRTSSGISDCWFLVEGTITLSYDEYNKLKVVVDAKNSYGQPVTALIAYEKIEPKNTVEINNAEVYVYDGYVELYGIMNFYGGNADGFMFDLYAYADTYAGDFLEAIDFGDCELTLADGSAVGVIDATEFKVEADGKNLTLTAKVLGSDTVQYNITATGYLGYIQGDAVEGYIGEFAVEEVAIQQVAISKVNYIYIAGTNAAGDQLALVVKGELEDGAIAAGTYNEVMACTGFDAEGQINPSYVGNNTGVWFIQSGELVVNENGAMAFAGVNSYDAPVAIGFTVPTPEVTDYYLVGWINDAAYGIEGDIDNFGDYHFVDGKVKATFDVLSYVQVKDNNKLIYGTTAYVAPAESGNATLVANGPEKVAINGGAEYEYTLVVNEDGTLTLSYEVVTVGLRNPKANVKAAKRVANGQIVIVRENKEYNILGAAL